MLPLPICKADQHGSFTLLITRQVLFIKIQLKCYFTLRFTAFQTRDTSQEMNVRCMSWEGAIQIKILTARNTHKPQRYWTLFQNQALVMVYRMNICQSLQPYWYTQPGSWAMYGPCGSRMLVSTDLGWKDIFSQSNCSVVSSIIKVRYWACLGGCEGVRLLRAGARVWISQISQSKKGTKNMTSREEGGLSR